MQSILIFGSILLGSFAQILLKIGTNKASSLDMLKIICNLNILSGLFLYGCSALLWIFAISKVELSYAYPMVSFGYVLVFGLSYLIFGEAISLLRVAGLVTIISGVIMIAKS